MFDQETSEEAAAELLQSYQVNTEQLGTKDAGQTYELTNAMAEIMMSRVTKRIPIKWKNNNKKHTQTKPALSNWSKFNVVTVNYQETKSKQRRNGTHTLGALKLLNGAQVS